MIGKLLSFATPYIFPAAGAIMVFALLFGGAQTWRMNRAKAALSELQAVIANERAQAAAAGLAAKIEHKETERQWIEAVQDGQKAIDLAKREFTAAVATVRAAAGADVAILRQRIDEASSDQAAPDSAASGGGDAATCGALLGAALQVAGECTVGAERHADTARSLLRAWPVDHSK